MKAKLKVIDSWEFEDIQLSRTSFKYSPTGGKEMVIRGENEIVFSIYHSEKKQDGILWIKGKNVRFFPTPEAKEQQDIWKIPVLLSCDKGILLLCGASNTLWLLQSQESEWLPISIEEWTLRGIPMKVAVTGINDTFPIVCRVDSMLEATNSFAILSVDFDKKTARWTHNGSCIYNKEKIRQQHLDAVKKVNGNFALADYNYNYPLIGSIYEQNEKLYAFLESSTINPAGLSMMGYYSYVEISKDGLIKRKLWGKDNLNQLPGKHGVRGKFSADQNYLIISPIFKNDEWKGKPKLLRLSDCTLIDVVMPRGYTSFRILDIWGNKMFISDDQTKLNLCEIIFE